MSLCNFINGRSLINNKEKIWSYWNYKGVALQYVVKSYLHTKIMNCILNTNHFDESKIPKEFKHKKNLQYFFSNLYNNFLKLEFLIISNKFPNWTQVESIKNFQISKKLDHKHSFIKILCHKILFLEFEQGKQLSSFDMRNAWWTINNLNCGIDVNIKSTCCSNFIQIIKI